LGACVEGFNEANGGKSKPEPMSNAEFDELLKIHNISQTLQ
jgi:hypothetical protein